MNDETRRALAEALGADPLRDWDDLLNAALCVRQERDRLKECSEAALRLAENELALFGSVINGTGQHSFIIDVMHALRQATTSAFGSE